MGANLYSTSLNLANSFKLNRNMMLAVLIAISALATMTQPYKIDSLFVFLNYIRYYRSSTMWYYLSGLLPSSSWKIHRLPQSDFQKWNLVPWITLGYRISVREIYSIRPSILERNRKRCPTVRTHYVYCET